jgi:hypothetical protein
MFLARNFGPDKVECTGQNMNLAAVWQMIRFSFRMLWTDQNEIPNMLQTSWIVIPMFLRISFFTQFHIFNCCTCWWTTQAISIFNGVSHCFQAWKTTQKLVLFLIICSAKDTFNISNIPLEIFPSLKWNLMQTFCCFKCAIYYVSQNCKWNINHTCA